MIARQKIDLMENTEHRTDAKIKCLESSMIKRYHFIEINLNITGVIKEKETGNSKQGKDIFHYLSDNVEMDVNQLYYADTQRRSIQTRFEMKKNISELKRQNEIKQFHSLNPEKSPMLNWYKLYTRNRPKKFLAKRSKMLYNVFFVS